jgi:hypothetical protein
MGRNRAHGVCGSHGGIKQGAQKGGGIDLCHMRHHALCGAHRKGLNVPCRAVTVRVMFRFLQSSDLHLGKPFGGFPDDIRHRLREARHGVIARLAAAARAQGAGVILLAGDTFDAETPAPATRRQALRAMAAEGDISWVLLPGNHDSLAATELWRVLAAECPANLTLALEAVPISLAPGVTLLPAPVTARRPGRDLSDWFDSAPSEGLRLGLAHGPVQDFDTGDSASLIAPDRAARAGLDWLALGDWHGEVRIGQRTAYAGTPERDGFKHGGHGTALAVALPGPGAMPQVETLPVGAFDWRAFTLDLMPGLDPLADLAGALPAPALRRDALMRVALRGRLGPGARAELMAALTDAAPDFGWLDWDDAGLTTQVLAEDLDLIDRAGALRTAAEALRDEAANPALSEAERAVAAAALDRLFALAQEVAP